jgi:cell division protein FtsI/penicillin-binding protein 2
MAAQVLGFVTYPDEASFEFGGAGQYGVEGAFDERLQGHPGYINAVTDVNMVPLSIGDENVTVPAKNGEDIVLSLDRNIQRAAERVVQAQAEATGADWANAVVVDARDGRVLAMANYPTYEPENFAKVTDASVYLNKVVTEPFEPGSVIKTFAFAMALEEGKITPELRFNNGNGIYTTVEGGYKIGNFEKKWGGEISMRDVFVHSLNTGMVQVLRQMGGAGDRITYEAKRTLYQYYSERYHLGQKTGIGVYEEPGLVMDPDGSDQSELRFANMTFGQGMTANMLQIAVGAAAVVNGGVYHAPYIEMGGAKEGERILSEKTSAEMRSVMVDAWRYLNKKNLREYVSIGGKTGTAEVPLATGGYQEGETLGDFVG